MNLTDEQMGLIKRALCVYADTCRDQAELIAHLPTIQKQYQDECLQAEELFLEVNALMNPYEGMEVL